MLSSFSLVSPSRSAAGGATRGAGPTSTNRSPSFGFREGTHDSQGTLEVISTAPLEKSTQSAGASRGRGARRGQGALTRPPYCVA